MTFPITHNFCKSWFVNFQSMEIGKMWPRKQNNVISTLKSFSKILSINIVKRPSSNMQNMHKRKMKIGRLLLLVFRFSWAYRDSITCWFQGLASNILLQIIAVASRWQIYKLFHCKRFLHFQNMFQLIRNLHWRIHIQKLLLISFSANWYPYRLIIGIFANYIMNWWHSISD